MAGGKATPRQKMINMMYLVLTALLALNVSKEILNAFIIVDNGLQKTKENLERQSGQIFSLLEKQNKNQPGKYGTAYNNAIKVKKDADALIKYVDELKVELIKAADGPEAEALAGGKINLTKLNSKDNYDIPTNMMVGNETAGPGKAKDLKEKLEKFKKDLLAMVDAKNKKAVEDGFSIDTKDPEADPEEPEITKWEEKIFHHAPMAAAIAHLSKIQTDIRDAEGDMVSYLFNSVSMDDFKFDQLVGIAVPEQGFVFKGNPQKVSIYLGAYDSQANPTIMVGGQTVKVENGVGVYTPGTGSIGEQKIEGKILIKQADGTNKEVPFNTAFTVGEQLGTVSPTKMNVFYIGVDNPIDCSVAGVSTSAMNVSGNGVTVTKVSGGSYIARPTGAAGSKCTVTVSAKLPDGKTISVPKEFRVKKVPDPVAMFLGSKGGKMPTSQVKVGQGLNCVLENFDFDLKFNITSFTMGANVKGNFMEAACTGNAFNSQAKDILSRLTSGSKVFFDNIKAKGPDGTTRNLQSFFVTCN